MATGFPKPQPAWQARFLSKFQKDHSMTAIAILRQCSSFAILAGESEPTKSVRRDFSMLISSSQKIDDSFFSPSSMPTFNCVDKPLLAGKDRGDIVMSINKSKAASLDELEEQLERSFAANTWSTVTDPKERKKAINAARLSKSERTNIRLSESDLTGIKQKASEKGIGYQTLISSLVHQYVTGRLMEVDPSGLGKIVSATVNAIFEKTSDQHKRPARIKGTIRRRAMG